MLDLSLDPFDSGPPDPDELWSATEESWQRQVPALEHVTARRDARHADAVLRGLTMSAPR
jgi:alpha,alpha-trehalase